MIQYKVKKFIFRGENMDLFEIKKDMENFTNGIEEIRGHL